MQALLQDIQKDQLAFIILLSLLAGFILSLIHFFKPGLISGHPKRSALVLSAFLLLGFPAILDLIPVGGFATYFGVAISLILLLNLVMFVLELKKSRFPSFLEGGSKRVLPFLIAGGLVTAGYLAYVDTTSTLVICGVEYSGCETVQTSPYVTLLGFLPTAVLGLLGYLAILTVWLVANSRLQKLHYLAKLTQWGLALFGVLFSIYLSLLEVFVIHATCSWCVTSAVIMNALLWYSTPPAATAYQKRQQELEEQSNQ